MRSAYQIGAIQCHSNVNYHVKQVYLGAIIHEEVVLGSPKLREKYGFKDL
jgi:hypothetical protein